MSSVVELAHLSHIIEVETSQYGRLDFGIPTSQSRDLTSQRLEF